MIELVDVRLDHPRGGAPLVADANFKIARGEVALVVGAAGVGTSRLVAATLGELAANAGRVEVFGRDVAKLRRSSLRLMRRRIGVVPQDLCLLDDRSAQLNVVLPLEIDGIPRTISIARAEIVLELLGLADEASLPVDVLSGSARQRVAVARALVRDPDIVLADHPTSLQDAAGAELVCAALASAADRGAAVIAFGRDPALIELAQRYGWRQLGLVNGALRPLGELAVDGATLDELLDARSAPTPLHPGFDAPSIDPEQNIVPFPIPARTAGVA
jgi:ABC-type ATPase involved in cell division